MKRMAFQGDNFVFPPPGSRSVSGSESQQGAGAMTPTIPEDSTAVDERPQTMDGEKSPTSHKEGMHHYKASYTASTLVPESPQVYGDWSQDPPHGIPHVPTPFNHNNNNMSFEGNQHNHHHHQKLPKHQKSVDNNDDDDNDDDMEIKPALPLHRKPSYPASTLAPDSPYLFEKDCLGYDIKCAIHPPSPTAAKREAMMMKSGEHLQEEFIIHEKGDDDDDDMRPRPLAHLPSCSSPIDEILASIPASIPPTGADDEQNNTRADHGVHDDDEHQQQPPPPPPQTTTTTTYLKGLPLHLTLLSVSLIILLISLDRAIITPALPHITSSLHSPRDIGWYGSAYLISSCAFQPIFGRAFGFLSVRRLYLSALATFMLGSLICGLSPKSEVLIFGRAVAGLGAAGLLSGGFVVVSKSVEMKWRAGVMGVVGLMYGVGATLGPLVGGVLTQLVSWRWCFWINLPAGLVGGCIIFFVFHDPPSPASTSSTSTSSSFTTTAATTTTTTTTPLPPLAALAPFNRLILNLKSITSQIDIPSSLLLLLTTTLLFLAIDSLPLSSSSSTSPGQQQQQQQHPYIWLLYLTLFALSLLSFILLQSRRSKKPTSSSSSSSKKSSSSSPPPPPLIPPKLLLQRTILASCLSGFLAHGTMLIHGYFLPLWLQIVQRQTPLLSGVGMIPYCVSTATFSLLAGLWVSRKGTYRNLAVGGSLLALVGAVAIANFDTGSGGGGGKEKMMEVGVWVGFEILAGGGIGLMVQLGFTAVQVVVLGRDDAKKKKKKKDGEEEEEEEEVKGDREKRREGDEEEGRKGEEKEEEEEEEGDQIPVAISLVTASQSLGGAVFVEVGNGVFHAALDSLGISMETETGAGLGIPDGVGEAEKQRLRGVYNEALTRTFWVAVPLCAVMLVACLFMEKRSFKVKKGTDEGDGEDDLRQGRVVSCSG